nr:glycosyltransferase [Paenibacillus sacheonensis]
MIQLAVDGLDRLVSVDSHFQTYCRAVCTFDDPEKLVLLPNAVDTAWFTGKDAEAGIGAGAEDGTQEKAVIGIVGGAEAAFGTEATEASRLRESAGAGGAEIAWASEAIGAADAENTDGHDAEDAESLDGRDAEDKESSDGHDAEDAEILERHDAQYAEDSPASEWTGNENAAALGAGGLAVADGLPETGELRLLFPRRLSYERGIVPMMLLADRLLAAFPSLIVEFAGELVEQTPVAVAFRLWLSTHGEQARIRHNTYTFQTVRDAYRAADVVVIPTVYSEGTSLSCLEAMSCGKAVVAANVGGLNDLITDGFNGRLVAPTVDALHAAVEELLRDAALRRQYGADASRTAAAFDLKRWKQRWAELLEAQFARNGL